MSAAARARRSGRLAASVVGCAVRGGTGTRAEPLNRTEKDEDRPAAIESQQSSVAGELGHRGFGSVAAGAFWGRTTDANCFGGAPTIRRKRFSNARLDSVAAGARAERRAPRSLQRAPGLAGASRRTHPVSTGTQTYRTCFGPAAAELDTGAATARLAPLVSPPPLNAGNSAGRVGRRVASPRGTVR
jgi:hypothetical protein